ncbi:DUF2793 domain-containing protein [Sphingomonas sp. KRR8]|uniref:DUF2793 domain-containing protein n=1 Tax=Sphingomonas sp. KRR8 TaxID=2942996 RepID=UPI0020213256|nr:DUF2793 domain-containing protein [Sphingomonas sp. KRR8]URD62204.1 DUF2793 domain-containing protein [Sphingomonas sp. KRR8]
MTTARFSLPLLQVGQSQKEVTHNESFQALESIVQPIVEGAPSNSPPTATPDFGRQYLVGAAPEGAFAGYPASLATWTEAGWRFTQPCDKLTAIDRLTGLSWTFDGGDWHAGIIRAAEVRVGGLKILGARQPAVALPSGGNVIDQQARTALGAIINALAEHGIIGAS